MIINVKEYRDKVLGCWIGKNIGGTLGAPFEWRRQINNVKFYTQNLEGQALPNDDLDVQLLWLIALEEQGIALDTHMLSEYWRLYVTPHWGEYGTAKVNLRAGLMPPLSGSVNNVYKDSCGAFIRSEIWACIAPGNPVVAAQYALQDAIIDHGGGEGTYAEVFCAALESAAFIERDIFKIIDIGLSYIPSDSGVAKAVKHVIECYKSGKSWQETRNEILTLYRGRPVPFLPDAICHDDEVRGFGDGPLGWDAPSNIAIVIIGLLYGEGDFGNSMCTAVNCGEDTDCTAATVGAIYGILNGSKSIPEEWIKPIGRSIKTACLNLGELGWYGNQLPQTVDELTQRTEKIAMKVADAHDRSVRISLTESTDLQNVKLKDLLGTDFESVFKAYVTGTVFRSGFFEVHVDYNDSPTLIDGKKKILITVKNRYKVQENINYKWYVPNGWEVLPADKGRFFIGVPVVQKPQTMEFIFKASGNGNNMSRFVLELTMEGRNTVILVPVMLYNAYFPPKD
jgi:ADP-ribosylglycohydrolase